MSIQVLYKKILNLELWHDYFIGQPEPPALPENYSVADWLTLVPTADCVRVLKNLRWVFRPQGQGGAVFASVDALPPNGFQLRSPLSQPDLLTFWLVVRDRNFANFTNLPLSPPPNQIYSFSNLSGNEDHALFLTRSLLKYSAGIEYRLGQLVTRSSKTLEAVQYKASASPTPAAKDWETLPGSQYVSDRDLLPYQRSARSQVIPSINPGNAFQFALLDRNGQEKFRLAGTAPANHPPGTSLTVNLNFGQQPPGSYRLTLNGSEIGEFVLANAIDAQNALGLIEIVLQPGLVSPAFALLELSGSKMLIRPKTYVIRFKNRSTRWLYRYTKPHGFQPSDLPNFELLDDRAYVTQRPLGLRFPPINLKDGEDHFLPAPGVSTIEPELGSNRQVTAIFSNIYL